MYGDREPWLKAPVFLVESMEGYTAMIRCIFFVLLCLSSAPCFAGGVMSCCASDASAGTQISGSSSDRQFSDHASMRAFVRARRSQLGITLHRQNQRRNQHRVDHRSAYETIIPQETSQKASSTTDCSDFQMRPSEFTARMRAARMNESLSLSQAIATGHRQIIIQAAQNCPLQELRTVVDTDDSEIHSLLRVLLRNHLIRREQSESDSSV